MPCKGIKMTHFLRNNLGSILPKNTRASRKNCYARVAEFATLYAKRGRDTYYIESFHNNILIYARKRIHFSDDVYNMRINLSVLDGVCIGQLF